MALTQTGQPAVAPRAAAQGRRGSTNGHAARFGYTVVASPLHDEAVVDAITRPTRALLADLGGRPDQHDIEQPFVVLVATGGTEQMILDLVERHRLERDRAQRPDAPTLLIAHGAHNSLPAALETLAALHQADHRGRIVQVTGDIGDRDALDRAITDLDVVHRFQNARIGLVGGASTWLVASNPPPEIVASRWGPHVEIIEPARLVCDSPHSASSSWRTDELASRFAQGADADLGIVTPVAIRSAAEIGTSLADVIDVERLDAVSVRCFDLLEEPGTSGCLALAALNDTGIVAGCEGDIPSTLAMMWARFLLDQPAWIANPARVDTESNRVLLAHCTVPPSMTDGYTLSTHFESGIGVGISGRFAPQPITLVRIGGDGLGGVWVAEGTIVSTGAEPDLCRTQVTVELIDSSVGDLLSRPLGNHLTLVAGHHRERFMSWWNLAIADVAN
jgi:L-fucose isomerase-like protein